MSKTLASLVSELQGEVPAEGGVPSTAQYQRAIKDAVMDFSRRAGQEKIWQLEVVSGTATYTLPDDFLSMIALESLTNPDGILYSPTNSQLIPIPQNYCERIIFRNGQLTLFPTPTYTLTRDMRYKAGWALNEAGDTYEDMGEEEASIILLKAQADCLKKKDNASSNDAYRYTIGGVTVDTTSQAGSSEKSIKSLEEEYDARVEAYVGQAFAME